ncbi:serine dehydratase beta chain [Streptomyces sp. NPDC003023]|uniref:serine dehydratase beta chain n=1 Tax=Streptomyces sp. NPDC003023 TaxID=3364675 RepID=UPI00367ED9CA
MALSVFDLYSAGIGPSSSHTVGPMRAARRFTELLDHEGLLDSVQRVRAELFGSLGATRHGHGSDKAVVLGLEGEDPATVDTDRTDERVDRVREQGTLLLGGKHRIAFDGTADLVLHRRRSLPAHPVPRSTHARMKCLQEQGSRPAPRSWLWCGAGFWRRSVVG